MGVRNGWEGVSSFGFWVSSWGSGRTDNNRWERKIEREGEGQRPLHRYRYRFRHRFLFDSDSDSEYDSDGLPGGAATAVTTTDGNDKQIKE